MAKKAASSKTKKAPPKPKGSYGRRAPVEPEVELGDDMFDVMRAAPKMRADFYTRFQKGQSGNPLGGKLHDPDIKAVRNLTKDELKGVANLVLKGKMSHLELLARHPEATVLQKMLASVSLRIIVNGDMGALDTLLNRLVGKVKDELDLGGDGLKPQIIVTLPANGREAKAS